VRLFKENHRIVTGGRAWAPLQLYKKYIGCGKPVRRVWKVSDIQRYGGNHAGNQHRHKMRRSSRDKAREGSLEGKSKAARDTEWRNTLYIALGSTFQWP
jgi:hypothetical protein